MLGGVYGHLQFLMLYEHFPMMYDPELQILIANTTAYCLLPIAWIQLISDHE